MSQFGLNDNGVWGKKPIDSKKDKKLEVRRNVAHIEEQIGGSHRVRVKNVEKQH